ncbi:tetratricopeptide repeat protein, partial [Xanthovirga aplysinae]|uniref:tetratricopeptide repeat protein n=1 Tax=Xanthovirga aplysinae TaxID=2529853 RepID=UPI001CA46CE7
MKKFLILTFVFFSFNFFGKSLAQKESKILKKKLSQNSYQELLESYNTCFKDSVKAKIYAEAFLLKAKAVKDVIKQADGYYMLASISERTKALIYADSIIEITKGIKDLNYPAKAHLLKGWYLAGKDKYKESMDELVQANFYANENKNRDQQFKIKYYIAYLKKSIGDKEENLNLLKSTENYFFNKFKEDKKYEGFYIKTLFALGDSYNANKNYDSAMFINKRAIKLSLQSKDSTLYSPLLLSTAIIHYYNKEYNSALDSLNKLQKLKPKIKLNEGNFIRSYLFRGLIFFEQGNLEKSIPILQKVDSMAFNNNHFFPFLRSGYELLI